MNNDFVIKIIDMIIGAFWQAALSLPGKIIDNWKIFLFIIGLIILLQIKLFRPVRRKIFNIIELLLNLF